MKKKNGFKIFALILNALGLFCLLFLAVPLLTHDTYVANPDAMLPMARWDGAGATLTFGFIPLLIANILGFITFKDKPKKMRLLFFLPSIFCAANVIYYIIISF